MKNHIVKNFATEAERERFVAVCEKSFEEHLEESLLEICFGVDLRFLGLTGPTCSGKTTAARKMTEILERYDHSVHVISLDDFYYDKEYLHKRAEEDPNIEVDYDSEETIDVSLLADVAERLFRGERTFIPHFDFKSGRRVGGTEILPKEKDVFLFEGIQTLYPKVSEILDRHRSYRSIAICPQSAITCGDAVFLPNEIRLYRRLVRDFRHRATSPEFTFYLWQSVRENEEKNIFPHLHTCYTAIDSTMPYEIGMLKPYLEPLMREIPPTSAFYGNAQDILKKLCGIQPISSAYIPEQSLYKEFI